MCRICIACLKLAKASKFLLCLKFFSNCIQSKSKQQNRRNRNKLISCSVTVKCFLLTQLVTAINFKPITIAYSVSALVVYLVLLLQFVSDKTKTVIMPQPPYSPDLAAASLFLFPKLKNPTKGKRFATIEAIKEKSKHDAGISVLHIKGSYFEGVKIVIYKKKKNGK